MDTLLEELYNKLIIKDRAEMLGLIKNLYKTTELMIKRFSSISLF